MFKRIHSKGTSGVGGSLPGRAGFWGSSRRGARSAGSGSRGMSGIGLSVFGLPFLVAGVFISWLYFAGLVNWWEAQGWAEVPCQIEMAKFESDGETGKATARYRYRYEGRTYRSDRVSFHSGSDNIGDFQQRASRELALYAISNPSRTPQLMFRCYVNPRNPEEAVLYRDFRWPMHVFLAIFALTFPAVGAGMVAGGIINHRKAKQIARLRDRDPEHPWKWNPAWQAGAIEESASRWIQALIAYTIWSGLVIGALLATAAVSGIMANERTSWLLGIFAALWCLPGYFCLRRIRHRMAVGITRFVPDGIPMVPGHAMGGSIVLEKPLSLREAAVVSLICEKTTVQATSDGTSEMSEVLWRHDLSLSGDALSRADDGYHLPVAFQIPADAPGTGEDEGGSPRYAWQLDFRAPGTPVRARFQLPVFRDGPSQAPTAAIDHSSILDDVDRDLVNLLKARKIDAVFDDLGRPLSLRFPPSRYLGVIIFMILFDVIWTAVAVILIKQQAPLLFRIVWPSSAALIWLLVIWQILHSRKVVFADHGLRIEHRFAGLGWSRELTKDEIARFDYNSNMSSGNVQYYRIRAFRHDGKAQTVADGIVGSTTAEALVKRLDRWHAPTA